MRARIGVGTLVTAAALLVGGSSGEGQSQNYVNAGAFDIQAYPDFKSSWFGAAYHCPLKERGHLCRASEWVAACKAGRYKPSGTPEWVDDLGPEEIKGEGPRALAMTDCERGIWLPTKENLPLRCCRNTSR